jgi:hypothetical protein
MSLIDSYIKSFRMNDIKEHYLDKFIYFPEAMAIILWARAHGRTEGHVKRLNRV